MTRIRATVITSLLVFISPAAVNYAAAQFECTTQECLISRRDKLNAARDALHVRERDEARKREEEARRREAELKQRAIEERKKITCTPRQGNIQHCAQHGMDLF